MDNNRRFVRMASIRSGIGENMKYISNANKPKTVEIWLTKEEFEKLKTVRRLDRVVFLDESSKECFTVYNLISDN